MTKVTVFEGGNEKVEEKKPIEFAAILSYSGTLNPVSKPGLKWDNICLLGKAGNSDYDLILAWNDGRDRKFIYLGYWNDGVVE